MGHNGLLGIEERALSEARYSKGGRSEAAADSSLLVIWGRRSKMITGGGEGRKE